jgi:glyoxylase-like metal-dependent hydrolase (beta-lactamase superfamily II)
MEQIVPGLWSFTGLIMGRVYLIADPDGLTILDTGITNAGKKILAQLQAAGYQPGDVKRILITHAHPDHAGSLPEVQKATGAQVYATEVERPVLEGKTPIVRSSGRIRPPETFLKPAPVHHTLADGETLPAFGGLQAVHTPGHSPGHVAFWQPEKRILFCGDVLFNMPRLSLPWALLTVDQALNKKSVKRIADLDARIVCFGHGKPMTENTAQTIRAFAARH